jgi:hypothetical protein
MKSVEVCWSLMKSREVSWSPLKSHEVFWSPLKSLEVSWSHLKSREVCWSPLKSFEVFRNLLKIWSPSCWSLVKSFEVLKSAVSPLIYSTAQNYKNNVFLIFLYDTKYLTQIQLVIWIANEVLYSMRLLSGFQKRIMMRRFLKHRKWYFSDPWWLCEHWLLMMLS